jgi:putative protein-disulfide isomerase
MCSWCYGFGPELAGLREGLPDLPVHVVLGGLRPNTVQPLDPALRATLKTHWASVEERTGLPFRADALDRPGFVYDTEPACRAVVVARMLAPEAHLEVFTAIQRGFYAEGKDVTQETVLAELACDALEKAGSGVDTMSFLAAFRSDATIAVTRNDFMQVKQWGVAGFPTLVLERDGRLDLVTSGYMAMPALVDALQALVDATPEQGQ